jgi:dUTP pyrophosphatase
MEDILFYGADAPQQAKPYDAGYDLVASHGAVIPSMGRALVNTSLRIAIPTGYVGLVCSRSGMSLSHGVFVLNAPGVIDPGYRNDIGVILMNLGEHSFRIEPGNRIAQIVFMRAEHPSFVPWCIAEEEDSANRGGGFGSTGK